MNNSQPGRGNKWEILKYVKPICSCEHTVIIRPVIVLRFINLRTYFSLRPRKENDTNSFSSLKIYDTAPTEQALPFTASKANNK